MTDDAPKRTMDQMLIAEERERERVNVFALNDDLDDMLDDGPTRLALEIFDDGDYIERAFVTELDDFTGHPVTTTEIVGRGRLPGALRKAA